MTTQGSSGRGIDLTSHPEHQFASWVSRASDAQDAQDTSNNFCWWGQIRCYSGCTNPTLFLAMFPPVVAKCTPGAFTLHFAFINFFLINSLMYHFPYSVYYLFPRHCCSLLELSHLLFPAWYTLFSLPVYFGFLIVVVACLWAFRFWAAIPKEFPLSFHRS